MRAGISSPRYSTLYFKPLDNTILAQVLIDDLIDIFTTGIVIPDTLRVNHDRRPFFTLAQTTGIVDTHTTWRIETQRLDPGLGIISQLAGAAVFATFSAVIAPVGTEKYMVFIDHHLIIA